MANIILQQNQMSIADIVNGAVGAVVNGEIDTMTALANLAKMRKALDAIDKDPRFREAIMAEVDKYSDRVITMGDVAIEKSEVGVKYDFYACGDAQWNELTQMAEAIKTQLAEREKFLRGIPEEGITQLDEGTGEVVTIHRPTRKSKSWIKVTFKK